MIELRDVTPENHHEVRALSVHPNQAKFVASVDSSLADAFVWEDALVKAGYHEGEAFGFVMIFPFEQDRIPIVNIVRIMVDATRQRQGLGRMLLSETLRWIRTTDAQRVRISTLSENAVALSLYKEFGFVESGIEDGEIAMYLNLPGVA